MDLPVPVEIRNEARVHLWYADRFGTAAPPFRDCTDAIDSFAAVCCCYVVTAGEDGGVRVYAPRGYGDLFSLTVRPHPRPAPRHVYESKTARWKQVSPELDVVPWDVAMDTKSKEHNTHRWPAPTCGVGWPGLTLTFRSCSVTNR